MHHAHDGSIAEHATRAWDWLVHGIDKLSYGTVAKVSAAGSTASLTAWASADSLHYGLQTYTLVLGAIGATVSVGFLLIKGVFDLLRWVREHRGQNWPRSGPGSDTGPGR